MFENHALEGIEFIITAIYVNQTGTWDILCNTEGLGKLQNQVQLQEEILSRLMNRERAENSSLATTSHPL